MINLGSTIIDGSVSAMLIWVVTPKIDDHGRLVPFVNVKVPRRNFVFDRDACEGIAVERQGAGSWRAAIVATAKCRQETRRRPDIAPQVIEYPCPSRLSTLCRCCPGCSNFRRD